MWIACSAWAAPPTPPGGRTSTWPAARTCPVSAARATSSRPGAWHDRSPNRRTTSPSANARSSSRIFEDATGAQGIALLLPAAKLAQHGDLLGRRSQESNTGAPERSTAPIRHHQPVNVDGLSRAGQVEGQRDARLRHHGYIARPAQGDTARSDVLGLAEVEPPPDRAANRADHGNPPILSAITFGSTPLDMHEGMVGTGAAGRKFPRDSPRERHRVFGDEVRDLVNDGIGQATGAAHQRGAVWLAFEPALALRASDDLQQLQIE